MGLRRISDGFFLFPSMGAHGKGRNFEIRSRGCALRPEESRSNCAAIALVLFVAAALPPTLDTQTFWKSQCAESAVRSI
jgi:hypothetical protein